jgi:hypothetical protein
MHLLSNAIIIYRKTNNNKGTQKLTFAPVCNGASGHHRYRSRRMSSNDQTDHGQSLYWTVKSSFFFGQATILGLNQSQIFVNLNKFRLGAIK